MKNFRAGQKTRPKLLRYGRGWFRMASASKISFLAGGGLLRSTGVRHAAHGGVYGRGLFWAVLVFVVLFVGAVSSAAQAQTPKIAAKQAEVAEAQARIEATLQELTEAQAAYDESQEKLGEVEKDISDNRRALEETEKKLDTAQTRLSDRAVGSYKSGGVVYLDVLLSVKSFADLSNKGKFVLQVLKQDRDAVVKIAALKKELASQQKNLEAKQQKQAGISARMRQEQAVIDDQLAEQRAVYDSLSGEVQRLIQEEQARQAREAARQLAEAEAQAEAERLADAQREAAARTAREQMQQFTEASEDTRVEVERQAIAESDARNESQRLAVIAAENEEKAAKAKKKAERDRLAAEAEEARQAAAEQAAAEEAARKEQERLVAEAQQAEQQALQEAEAARQAEEQAAADAAAAAEEAAAEEAASAAEEQYTPPPEASEPAADAPETSSEAAPEEAVGVTSSDPRVQAVLDNPSINLTSMAQQDLASGMIDSRVLDVVEFAAQEYTISISVFSTGHPFGPTLDGLGLGGYPNAHYYGRAVDIYEVDGASVTSGNAAAQSLAQAIFDNFGPAELGSPWTFGEGSFSDALHQDHIHVGWAYGSDGGL